MKYILLIRRNLMRNKRRTILTALGLGVALFLFSTIRTVVAVMGATVQSAARTPTTRALREI